MIIVPRKQNDDTVYVSSFTDERILPYIDSTGDICPLKHPSRSKSKILLTPNILVDNFASYYGYNDLPQNLPFGGGSYVSYIQCTGVLIYWYLCEFSEGDTSDYWVQIWYIDNAQSMHGKSRPLHQLFLGIDRGSMDYADFYMSLSERIKSISGEPLSEIRKKMVAYMHKLATDEIEYLS